MGNRLERATVGATYYAPTSDACKPVPLIAGERRGVFVDADTQDAGVVYTTREGADAALADPTKWHPRNAARFTVRAIVVETASPFRARWAS